VKIRILIEGVGELKGELTDGYSPLTFAGAVEALPVEGIASRWGDELYFEVPVEVGEENHFETVIEVR